MEKRQSHRKITSLKWAEMPRIQFETSRKNQSSGQKRGRVIHLVVEGGGREVRIKKSLSIFVGNNPLTTVFDLNYLFKKRSHKGGGIYEE